MASYVLLNHILQSTMHRGGGICSKVEMCGLIHVATYGWYFAYAKLFYHAQTWVYRVRKNIAEKGIWSPDKILGILKGALIFAKWRPATRLFKRRQ